MKYPLGTVLKLNSSLVVVVVDAKKFVLESYNYDGFTGTKYRPGGNNYYIRTMHGLDLHILEHNNYTFFMRRAYRGDPLILNSPKELWKDLNSALQNEVLEIYRLEKLLLRR